MNQEKKKFNVIENVIFSLGVIVLIALVGYLVFQITQKNGGPPDLIITNKYQSSLPNYAFEIQVTNQGHTTARMAQINFVLFQEGKLVESASIQMDYIPVNSKKVGWLVFVTEKKSNDSLVVSSMTFLAP